MSELKEDQLSKYRVILEDVCLSPKDGEQVKIEVILSFRGHKEQAERVGKNQEEEVLRLVALTTMDAINQLLPRPLDMQLEYIQKAKREGEPPSIISLIHLYNFGKVSFLNGSCPMVGSIEKTAAQTVVYALNKTIEHALQFRSMRNKIKLGTEEFSDIATTFDDVNSNKLSTAPILCPESEVLDVSFNTGRGKYLASQADLFAMKGNYGQAVSYYTQAITFDPDNAHYYNRLGLALSNLPEQNTDAEKALKKAIELDPKKATYHIDLGMLYKNIGLVKQTRQEFQAVLALETNNVVARRELQDLTKYEILLSKTSKLYPITKRLSEISQEQDSILRKKVTPPMLIVLGVFVISLASLVLATLYISNLPYFNQTPVSLEKTTTVKALERVQGFPSPIKGLSVKEFSEKFATEQNITKYGWSSGQDKENSHQYIIMFSLKKKKGKEYAIWRVNLKEGKISSVNSLAKLLSGL